MRGALERAGSRGGVGFTRGVGGEDEDEDDRRMEGVQARSCKPSRCAKHLRQLPQGKSDHPALRSFPTLRPPVGTLACVSASACHRTMGSREYCRPQPAASSIQTGIRAIHHSSFVDSMRGARLGGHVTGKLHMSHRPLSYHSGRLVGRSVAFRRLPPFRELENASLVHLCFVCGSMLQSLSFRLNPPIFHRPSLGGLFVFKQRCPQYPQQI